MVADTSTTGETTDEAPDVSTLGYEQARDELVRVVGDLEAGSAPLERSLALWERGEALAARCEQLLAGAQERLDQAAGSGGAAGEARQRDRSGA